MLADGIDTAIWSQHPSVNVELAVQPIVPLAIEAGLRYGLSGVVVPLSTGITTNAANIIRRKPLTLAPFCWPILGTLFGIGLAMLETHHLDTVMERFSQELQARTHQAELAGQNEVAMGADSVADELCRSSPLVGDEVSEKAIGAMIHAWKAALATETEVGAVYLGNALAEWQRHHNTFQADLTTDVWFEVPPGEGTLILTGAQARWLSRICHQLDLVGAISVVLENPGEGHRPGRAVAFSVDGKRLFDPRRR